MTIRKGAIAFLASLALTAQAFLACPLAAASLPSQANAPCPMHMQASACCKHKSHPSPKSSQKGTEDCPLCYLQRAVEKPHSTTLVVFDHIAALPQKRTWSTATQPVSSTPIEYRTPHVWNLERPPDLPRGPPSA